VRHNVTVQGSPGATVEVTDLILDPAGHLHITDQMTLAPDGRSTLHGGTLGASDSATLHNQGDMTVAGAVLFDGGDLLNTNLFVLGDGALQMDSGAVFTNHGDGVSNAWLRFTSDADITDVSGGGTAPVIVNEGIVEKTAGVGTSVVEAAFENTGIGRVSARSGTLHFSGAFTNDGSLHAGAGATLGIDNAVTVQVGQSLTGGGTFDVPSLTVAVDLSPGDASLGTLATTGHLVLESTSHSLFEIGGISLSQYDALHAGGDFTPGGQVSIDFVNGFAPAPGDIFTLWQADGAIHGEILPGDIAILDDPGLFYKLKHFEHMIQLGIPRVIQSVVNGNWTAGSTWQGGEIPNPFDTAIVRHEVSLRGSSGATVRLDALVLEGPDGFLSISNAMTLAVDGESTLNGGFLQTSTSGGGTLHNLGQMTVTDTTTAVRGHLLNTGDFILDGASYEMTSGSTLDNTSDAQPDGRVATIRFLSDHGILVSSAPGGGGAAPSILNQGLIEKTGGDGVSEIGVRVELDGSFNGTRSGEVDARTGTIRFTSEIFGSGAHFTADDGAAIEIAGDFYLSTDVNRTFTYTGGGEGHLRLVTGGGFRGTAAGNSGTSPEDTVRAVLDFDPGFFEWIGGNFTHGTTKNIGQITILGDDAKSLSARFVNAGAMFHHGDGTLGINGSEGLINDIGGVYEFLGDGDWGRTGTGSPGVVNRGLIVKNGGTGASVADLNITNTGTIRVTAGTLSFTGNNFNNSGDLFVEAGATLHIADTSNVVVPLGATLGGGGAVEVPKLAVTGRVTPGDSAGTLTVLGDLLFDTGAVYDWEISDTANDLIDVQGTLTFGSAATLNIIPFGATPPAPGEYDLFQFVGAAPTLPAWTLNLPAGWEHHQVFIEGQFVKLGITAVPEPASAALFVLGAPRLFRRRL